jgi:hypothetical protein
LFTWNLKDAQQLNVSECHEPRIEKDKYGIEWTIVTFPAYLRSGSFPYPIIFQVSLKTEYIGRFVLGNMEPRIDGMPQKVVKYYSDDYESDNEEILQNIQKILFEGDDRRKDYDEIVIRIKSARENDLSITSLLKNPTQLVDVKYGAPDYK